MDREGDFAVVEATGPEVKPALGVTLVVGALGVRCSPETVVVVGSADGAVHVAGVELAAEVNKGLAGLSELETTALRQLLVGFSTFDFHFKAVVIKI